MSLNDTADFQRKIHEFQTGVTRHLEMMAAAYMKATNIPPEECELVVETLPNKMVYRFQRRRTPLAADLGKAPAKKRVSKSRSNPVIKGEQ